MSNAGSEIALLESSGNLHLHTMRKGSDFNKGISPASLQEQLRQRREAHDVYSSRPNQILFKLLQELWWSLQIEC
jgi:hypothetical protein